MFTNNHHHTVHRHNTPDTTKPQHLQTHTQETMEWSERIFMFLCDKSSTHTHTHTDTHTHTNPGTSEFSLALGRLETAADHNLTFELSPKEQPYQLVKVCHQTLS